MLRISKSSLMLSTGLVFISTVSAQEGAQDARELDTVVVRGEFIPEPQRETSQIASFLSSEDLTRQGDANAALALTRLSGLSVVGGRFAYVRGLGDRYSFATLNGASLPSPEPLRRTVPLDLFPSSVLEGAEVQKTYTAGYSADFGGGAINLTTLQAPDEPFLNIKVGAGINTETTLENGLRVDGDDWDWTGYDDGLRDIPDLLQNINESGAAVNTLTAVEREALGDSFNIAQLSDIDEEEIGPDLDIAVNGGTLLALGEYDVGIVFAGGFDRSFETKEAQRQFIFNGEVANDNSSVRTSEESLANAFGSLSVEREYNGSYNTLTATGLYVHQTDEYAEIVTRDEFQAGVRQREDQTGWIENELIFGQLSGVHENGDLVLNWRGSYSEASRSAPYEIAVLRDDQPGVGLIWVGDNATTDFSTVTDENSNIAGDLNYTFDVFGREIVLRGGGEYTNTDRLSLSQIIRFNGGGNLSEDIRRSSLDVLFDPDNIGGADGFFVSENSGPNQNYFANLEVYAGFAEAEFDITNFIQGTLGFRYEESDEGVITFDRNGNIDTNLLLTSDYVLPAASATWNFADNLQLRLAYSETIARPQFRELSPVVYNDPESNRSYTGNRNLQNTEFTNFDARLEYYLGRNQFITGAVFYKDIDNPIEETVLTSTGSDIRISYINAPKAVLSGVELEYRNRFQFWSDNAWFADRDWLFSTNYTYTSAEVEADAGDTVIDESDQVRPASDFALDGAQLQGTPENVLNLQFGWESQNDQMTLLVGWVDERVLQRGTGTTGVPDIIEDPGVQVDLVYKRDLIISDRALTLGVSARNLLNESNEEFQETATGLRADTNTYDRGVSVSASLTAKF